MSKSFQSLLAVTGLIGAALLSACGGGDDAPVAPADKTVAITFAAVNGSAPVACGSTPLTGMGSTGVTAGLQDLRFYITNVKLINDKGEAVAVKLAANSWQLTQGTETVSLIDLENATGTCNTPNNTTATNAVITGTVPAGNYVGLKATMGVPDNMNHSAIAGGVPPLDISPMAWSWQSGRKFAKIEINPVGGLVKPDGSTVPTFNFHLGSTGCTAKLDANGAVIKDAAGNTVYTCTNPNAMDFSLAAFNADTQKVVLDIGKLFSTTNVTQENGGAPGCMSGATDPECPTMFSQLQVTFGPGSTGLPINGGAAQQIFKAAAK